jgi:hypothetical protein
MSKESHQLLYLNSLNNKFNAVTFVEFQYLVIV